MSWKLVATLRSKDGSRGHRLFSREHDGATVIGIADNSGATPDRTEDGTLLVRRVEIHDTRIKFALHTGAWTGDDLSEVNARAVWCVVRALNIPMEGMSWIGRLVMDAIRTGEGT